MIGARSIGHHARRAPSSPDTHPALDREAAGLRRWIADAASASVRRRVALIVVAALLTVGSAFYVARHFAIDTDSAKLISDKVAWRQRSAAFDAAFPDRNDLIAIVVDGVTPDLAEHAAATLTARLAKKTDLFHVVRRPDGGPFFDRNGLLFLDAAEVRKTTDAARRVAGGDRHARRRPERARARRHAPARARRRASQRDDASTCSRPASRRSPTTVDGVVAGRPRRSSWRSMLGGASEASPRELRRFVLVQPVLDYHALEPGAQGERLHPRDGDGANGLDPAHGVRVRLTGNVPMADEEFGTLEEHADRNAGVMLDRAVRDAVARGALGPHDRRDRRDARRRPRD